jgi:hypothetical protein
MVLGEEQLKQTLLKAKAGEGTSALRLSLHYMSLGKQQEARHWRYFSAARGNATAQYNIWFDLKDRNDCRSRLEALAWLKSAALSGQQAAQREIDGFERLAKTCQE